MRNAKTISTRQRAALAGPVVASGTARMVDFQTEDGIFGFRYETLQYYRWENHSKELGPQAIHFFFSAATVSIVGHELDTLLSALRRQAISEVRLGKRGRACVTYIAVLPTHGQKKHEGVNRGLALK